ncbi:element excision factor XisI family protein [Microcystis aeruginosa]|uniref:element excision factor XisI family protein n=1 Tax=Microcystis aeruginosa TaxID=1126 RepID=UPI00232F3460|nr:element excision factor XisI family protein [Microcystis aeruginosa]MDB9415548.1 element excision factor XisI family protein [Microcystis aeruginosa CS-556/03]
MVWRDSSTRIYGCIIHVDIINNKIWVQHDGTEEAIADKLVARGVPKQDIVLAYHAPHVRQYTEFALG